MTESSDDPRLQVILDELPAVIWFAFGVDLGKYVAQVKTHDAKRDHKTLIFVIVNSVEEALRATNEWGVDVLVVQGPIYPSFHPLMLLMFALTGNEAGGHGGSQSPPMISVVKDVVDAIPNGPPILAAGGVSSGGQIAALLTLGASGVVLGTRFLFTPECCYSDAQKSVLVEADYNATQRATCFDEVGRTNFWPPLHNGRAIANQIWTEFAEGLSLEERLKRHDENKESRDRLIIWAGIGAGATKDIKPAAVCIFIRGIEYIFDHISPCPSLFRMLWHSCMRTL